MVDRALSDREVETTCRHRLSLLLLAVSVMVAGCVWVPAAGASSRPKPDLVVTAFRFESSPPHEAASLRHVVLDGEGRGEFAVVYTVKNVGDHRSPESIARVVVSGHRVGDEPVGPIPAGGKSTYTHQYTARFRDLGEYEAFACADWGDQVNESNEHNNCNQNVSLEAIPRRWVVDTFTAGPNSLGGPPFWSSKSVGMSFAFEGIITHDHQRFFLWLAKGGVTGRTSGSDSVCTYTGHGAVSHSPWDVVSDVGYLEITPELNSYSAEIEDSDYHYTQTTTCPSAPWGNGTTQQEIAQLQTLDSEGNPDQPMAERSRTLTGNYNVPVGFHGSSVGQWSFKADVP